MPCIKRPSINDSINIVTTIINVVFATCVVQYLTKCTGFNNIITQSEILGNKWRRNEFGLTGVKR